MQKITWNEITCEVDKLCKCLELVRSDRPPELLWPIPCGGLFIAGLMVSRYPRRFRIVMNMYEATLLVDDIICSGATACVLNKLSNLPVVAPYWRTGAKYNPIVKARILLIEDYLIFPWEHPTEAELVKEIAERSLV